MKITIEIDLDDTDKTEAVSRIVDSVARYAAGFISTCVVKAGRMEVHETGVFGAVYKDANNVKITIDRSEPLPKRAPYKVFACHSFTGRCSSLNCYAVSVAPTAEDAARLLDMQLYAEGIEQRESITSLDMIEVDLSAPRAFIVKDE